MTSASIGNCAHGEHYADISARGSLRRACASFPRWTASPTLFGDDRNLLVPLDPDDVLGTWRVSNKLGLACGGEPLDRPRDRFLAKRVVANRALVHATDHAGLDVDFTLVPAPSPAGSPATTRMFIMIGSALEVIE